MTAGGYITDRTCPGVREHGNVHDMPEGGHYCPNHEHDFPVLTKNYWTADEFEAAKSATTLDAPGTPQALPATPRKRVTKRRRR